MNLDFSLSLRIFSQVTNKASSRSRETPKGSTIKTGNINLRGKVPTKRKITEKKEIFRVKICYSHNE